MRDRWNVVPWNWNKLFNHNAFGKTNLIWSLSLFCKVIHRVLQNIRTQNIIYSYNNFTRLTQSNNSYPSFLFFFIFLFLGWSTEKPFSFPHNIPALGTFFQCCVNLIIAERNTHRANPNNNNNNNQPAKHPAPAKPANKKSNQFYFQIH